ncbi:hypothetical protein [Nostoc sp. CCY0012]
MIIVSDTSPITNLAAIDQLIATADFRVSQKLYAIVLQSADEG